MELENYIHQVMSKRERSTHLIGGNGTIRNIRVIVIIEDFHKICCRWKKDIKGSASKKHSVDVFVNTFIKSDGMKLVQSKNVNSFIKNVNKGGDTVKKCVFSPQRKKCFSIF